MGQGASADTDKVRLAYDTVAEDYAVWFPDTRAEAPVELAMIDTFADAATDGEGARILDAGCGSGRMTRYLAGLGGDVEGLDLSQAMIDVARREHGDLKRPGSDGGSQSMKDESYGCTEEVQRRAA
jgi:2-polyprenyl-3-methyl-5-hydroxy-6-metoxy-1,4-benzoquinol methylase